MWAPKLLCFLLKSTLLHIYHLFIYFLYSKSCMWSSGSVTCSGHIKNTYRNENNSKLTIKSLTLYVAFMINRITQVANLQNKASLICRFQFSGCKLKGVGIKSLLE